MGRMIRDLDFCTFARYPTSRLLPIPKACATKSADVNINATTGEIENAMAVDSPWLEDDIVDSFGPSRLPPRVVIKFPGDRKAAWKEINDLIAPHGAEPPAMVEVALNDSRFRPVPKIRSTLCVKRKSIGIYNCRLCARGDSVPLNRTPFTSSPTAHRCGAK